MTIPTYPIQLPPQNTQIIGGSGMLQVFYNFVRVLFLRTGGASGITQTVATGLTSSGQILADDYNEVLHTSSGAVILAALQPGQTQTVFNGTGGMLNVFANGSGTIDGSSSYGLGNGKTQFFFCTVLLANGSPSYRSTQLG